MSGTKEPQHPSPVVTITSLFNKSKACPVGALPTRSNVVNCEGPAANANAVPERFILAVLMPTLAAALDPPHRHEEAEP